MSGGLVQGGRAAGGRWQTRVLAACSRFIPAAVAEQVPGCWSICDNGQSCCGVFGEREISSGRW